MEKLLLKKKKTHWYKKIWGPRNFHLDFSLNPLIEAGIELSLSISLQKSQFW